MEDELPVKKRMKFEDPLQGDALNREEATDVLPFTMQFVTDTETLTPLTSSTTTTKLAFHRMTEYMVYVGILGSSGKSVSFLFSEEDVNKIRTESLSCKEIGPAFAIGKSFPNNVSTSCYGSIPFTVTVQATDGTTKEYAAKLMVNASMLYIENTSNEDIFELGKGDHTLLMLCLVALVSLFFFPAPTLKLNITLFLIKSTHKRA